jgi:hypothetical protein
MKKFFTLLFVVSALLSAEAQVAIYSQNFSGASLPSGWQNVDNTGTGAGVWLRKTTGYGFQSSSAANGHMVFDSDGGVANDNKPEDADLITAPINCTGHNFVALEFQEYFSQYQTSEGTVYVSNDGNTWTQVYSVSSTTDNPHTVKMDISNIAANQPTVYIKFNFQGNWDLFWAIDDIRVFEPAALDISVDNITLNQFVGLGSKIVTGTITNNGGTTVTSATLTYTDNGGAPVSQTFNNLGLLPFQSYNYTFSQPIIMSTPLLHSVVVTADAVNSAPDLVTSNNTFTKEVTALSAIPRKNTLIEEFTTAPCQYCPRGTTEMNRILAANSNIIGVALHAGFGTDAMTTPDHSTIANAYADGAPTACIDRVRFGGESAVAVSTNVWETYGVERTTVTTPVSISASNSYDNTTRVLTIDASARFYGPINDDFRINAYIIEDSVSGTGSGYNQVNAFNGTSTSEWYQKGNPIIGFKHRHVTRMMLGGPWGTTGVIANPTVDGEQYTKQYTHTLPSTWNDSRISVVVLVQHYSANIIDRHIINALELHLNSADSIVAVPSVFNSVEETGTGVSQVTVYPNPASNLLNIEYALSDNTNIGFEVSDMLGRTVQTSPANSMSSGNFRTTLNTSNFENGVYFLSVKEEGKVVKTIKFIVSK